MIWKSVFRFFDHHFAGFAVKDKREAATIVYDEERFGVVMPMMLRTHAEFISDAVSAAHELFGTFFWRKLYVFETESAFAIAQCNLPAWITVQVFGKKSAHAVDGGCAQQRQRTAADLHPGELEVVVPASL